MRTRTFLRADATSIGVTTRCGRQPPRRGVVAELCVFGLACGLAVTACTSTSGGAAGQPAGGTAGAPIASSLRQRINAAQDPAGYLIKATATQTSPGGAPSSVTTVWTDPTTGNAMMQHGSGSSRVASWQRDYYQNRVLHWDTTQVDYGPRTWWTADEQAAAPTNGSVPAGPAGGGYTPAALIKEVLGQAAGTIVGHPVVDGRRTIELSATTPGARFDIWADSRTGQVIRTVKYFLAAMRFPPITSDFSWVRTSTAMVYLINHPRVPAGYTRVRVGQYGSVK